MTRASSLTAVSRPLYCCDRSRSAIPAAAASVTLPAAAPAESSRTSMNIGRVEMYLCMRSSTAVKTQNLTRLPPWSPKMYKDCCSTAQHA